MMKVVVLDGHTANPGDLSWEGLSACGELQVYPCTEPDQLFERAHEAEILLTNKVQLQKPELDRLPDLRYIGVLATGYNVVDLEECRRRGIAVTNIPGYSSHSVCQLTFGLILALAHQLVHHNRLVVDRSWSRSKEFCLIEKPLIELAGLTLGIVGFGQIAREVATVALAFGMDVLVYTAHPENYRESWPQFGFVELDELAQESDLISLHCPLTESTRHLVDAAFLARMKPGALLINTARGPVIDQNAVATALQQGRLAGYGADVLDVEPPPSDNPLLDAPNCLLTPHIAWGTQAARQRLLRIAGENLAAFVAGESLNRIV